MSPKHNVSWLMQKASPILREIHIIVQELSRCNPHAQNTNRAKQKRIWLKANIYYQEIWTSSNEVEDILYNGITGETSESNEMMIKSHYP